MEVKRIAWCAALWMCVAFTATAQENEAPQVLTSDLALRQVVTSEKLTVNFVIVDDDKVVKVTIDGEPQNFTPEDTVMLVKEFTFTPGRRVIRVEVEDEKGNKRERTFLVAYGVPLAPLKAKKEEKREAKLRINYVVEGAYEIDTNPTQDLSLPFKLDGEEVQGVVDDSEQEDTRQTAKGVVSMSTGPWAAFFGFSNTAYSDPDNESLGSFVFFIGGNWSPGQGEGFQVAGTYSDVDIGGEDYATLLTVTPGLGYTSSDEDGTQRAALNLEITSKSFDSSERSGVTQFALKWVRNDTDKENLDRSKKTWSLGSASEGTPDSEFSFLGYDADWKNRWESGFRLDIGFGYQYRTYPNDEDIISAELFGTTRVDNVLRFSTGLGWAFTPSIEALLNYRYLVDLSNDSPYVRTIYGLNVKGTF